MLARNGDWWFGQLFGPKNRRLFHLRLSIRIMLLRLRLWWSQFRFWQFFKVGAIVMPVALVASLGVRLLLG